MNPGQLWAGMPGEKQNDIYIAIHLKNATLRQALDEVGQKSGLSITYNDADLVRKADNITYAHEHITVNQVLDYLLKDTGLAYREFKGIIVIYKIPPPPKTQVKGSIEGTLSDAETGESLIGANVRILGTSLGSNADENGHYEIKQVPSGSYQLAVSYIGYETSIVRDVKVEGGQATRMDHKLAASKTELQSIEVIGNAVLSGNVVETNELALVNSIKASPLIITGISAQQIARSIDQDAGEVARRLPGVSILNNFVNIRGMHERYNLTVLNDMIAPSSESDRRAFSYDLLPSNMIDKMTVYRSPSPDLLADWAGGIIKVETKNTSIARQIEINLSGWVREGTTFKDYYTGATGSQDWLGKDDGTRALPGGFPAINQIPGASTAQVNTDRTRNLGAITADEAAQNAQWGQKLMGNWNLKTDKAPIDYRAGINYYDSWLIGKMRLNNLTSINTTQATQVINQNFYPSRFVDEHGKVNNARAYEDTIGRKTARWGLLQNLRLRINPSHTLEVKGMFNQLGSDETYVRKGYNNIISEFDLGYVTKIFYTYRSRSILATQLAGKHALGSKKDHQLSWSGAYSASNELVPAQRLITLIPEALNLDNPLAPRYISRATNEGPFSIANSLYYSESYEKNFTGFLDYEKKIGEELSVRFGFFDEKKTRDIDGRLIAMGNDPNPPTSNFLLTGEGRKVNEWNAEDVLGPQNFKESGGGLFIYDNQYLSGQYHVDGNIAAGYAAVQVPVIARKLSLYGGVRFENQHLEISTPVFEPGIGQRDEVIVKRSTPYWLPSVNLKYTFHPQLAFRAAYGKTINRPNYREMIPLYVNDPKLEMLQFGNKNLKDATIDNFDVRLEWYPSESEFISVGLFYKKISNAIEPYVFLQGKLETLMFSNTSRADVRGVEFELRKSLGSLAPVRWLQYFSTIANFAWLDSEVKFQDSLFVTVPGSFSDFRPKTRQLEGTAKYVVNAGLYFEQPQWGTKISLLYNILGQRLVYAGTAYFPGTYELPRNVVDLTVRQQLTRYLELRAGVQDLLNQPRKLYRDYNRDEKYNPDLWNKLPFKDYTFQKFKPGSYWMVGINITL